MYTLKTLMNGLNDNFEQKKDCSIMSLYIVYHVQTPNERVQTSHDYTKSYFKPPFFAKQSFI